MYKYTEKDAGVHNKGDLDEPGAIVELKMFLRKLMKELGHKDLALRLADEIVEGDDSDLELVLEASGEMQKLTAPGLWWETDGAQLFLTKGPFPKDHELSGTTVDIYAEAS